MLESRVCKNLEWANSIVLATNHTTTATFLDLQSAGEPSQYLKVKVHQFVRYRGTHCEIESSTARLDFSGSTDASATRRGCQATVLAV